MYNFSGEDTEGELMFEGLAAHTALNAFRELG